ncbi:MAG TPA: hypothetical protein VGK36_10625 [Candidatus Angelobacter sp.]
MRHLTKLTAAPTAIFCYWRVKGFQTVSICRCDDLADTPNNQGRSNRDSVARSAATDWNAPSTGE